MSANLGVIVLAAGMGTRMKSRLHKVLHPVCGVPMGIHVINAARELQPRTIAVVVGHQSEAVRGPLVRWTCRSSNRPNSTARAMRCFAAVRPWRAVTK
ncbi:MAG: NTP transferase domain-containing protein [Dehalococcoidia bacterium]|nr:NTP transferase domain-containing protein [Dehalococcoidia bacterium]